MAINKFKPEAPDRHLKKGSDMSLAKFGHLNRLVDDINAELEGVATGGVAYTQAEKTKLAGIATGATANDTDANLKNRANHTGTQAFSTISGTATAAQIPSLDAAKISTGTFALARVNAPLTGYAIGTAGAIAATDTIMAAIAKLEARIAALEAAP